MKYAKKVTLRDAKEDVDKVHIEVQNTSHNAGGKPILHAVSHFNTITFSAFNYSQDFGFTVKGWLKRSGLHL